MSVRSKKIKFSVGFVLFLSLGTTVFGLSILDLLHLSNGTIFFSKISEIWIPLVLGILVLPLIGGALLFVTLTYWERMILKPIESSLHALNSGIQIKMHKKTFQLERESFLNQSIQEDILQAQSTIQELSKELQIVHSKPQLFSGQTKEEILEFERQRLARELHDSVSQELFAAMMMLSAISEVSNQNNDLQPFHKQLKMVTEIINRAQSEMRALLLHLRPVNLEGKSLKMGIEQLLLELQTKVTIKISWSIQDLQLPINIEDQLFRVTQELLSNTLRHSKANELEVYLHKVDQSIFLRFIDDGVGFDTSKKNPGSYGLTNIQERIQTIGGNVKIISFKDQGTSIEIKVPVLVRGDE